MPHDRQPPPTVSLADRLRVAPLYALPHHLLSALMRRMTRVRWRAWKNWQIRWFIRRYGVDMAAALEPSPEAYEHFNAFFTRALRPQARPVCDGERQLACPADGTLSEFGRIDGDRLLQAKGHRYSLTRLLGGDAQRAQPFQGGSFATVYLSPRDYHRVHMPQEGRLREMAHVPGRLFSVNPASVRAVPGLFARNERVVSIFDSPVGPMAVVLVGAVFVGCIEQVWAGRVTPRAGRRVSWTRYPPEQAAILARGEEMGRFNMGSTVIVVLPPGPLRWRDGLAPGRAVRMGEALATIEAGRTAARRSSRAV